MAHAWDKFFGEWNLRPWFFYGKRVVDRTDIFACHVENMIRAEHGIPLRTHYIKNSPYSSLILFGNGNLYYTPYHFYLFNNF